MDKMITLTLEGNKSQAFSVVAVKLIQTIFTSIMTENGCSAKNRKPLAAVFNGNPVIRLGL